MSTTNAHPFTTTEELYGMNLKVEWEREKFVSFGNFTKLIERVNGTDEHGNIWIGTGTIDEGVITKVEETKMVAAKFPVL